MPQYLVVIKLWVYIHMLALFGSWKKAHVYLWVENKNPFQSLLKENNRRTRDNLSHRLLLKQMDNKEIITLDYLYFCIGSWITRTHINEFMALPWDPFKRFPHFKLKKCLWKKNGFKHSNIKSPRSEHPPASPASESWMCLFPTKLFLMIVLWFW